MFADILKSEPNSLKAAVASEALDHDEIESLRTEYQENIGEPLEIQDNLKNFLAWFAL